MTPDGHATATRPIPRRDAILQILAEHRDELARRFGVTSLELFGSAGRDEARTDSDVDLLVEFDRPPGLEKLLGLREHLQSLLGTNVDLVTPDGLRPWFREHIRREIESGGRLKLPRNWSGRIQDMLDAVGAIAEYTDGMTIDSFTADRRTVDAVVRNIEIIGEAARHVPDEVRARYPAVPWQAMNDMRNVVIHNYPTVDLPTVWDVISNRLPPLVTILREVLERERASDEDGPADERG